MTRSLLPNVLANPGWTVVAAADSDAEACARFSSQFPGITVFLSGGSLIEAAQELNLHAVFIAVDPVGHVTLAHQAVTAGLNVFVEKPCGGDARELFPLAEIAKWSGVIVMVGTMWRYTKAAHLLRTFVSAPERGRGLETLSIHACFPELLQRNGWGGDMARLAFLDMFIHPIDFACWFLRAPLEIRSLQTRPFESGKGSVILIIQAPNSGRTANLHLICGSNSYSVDIAASCADGSLARIRDLSELQVVTSPTWSGTEGGFRDRAYLAWEHGPLYRGYGRHGYAEEVEAFRLALTDGHPVLSVLDEALHTMDVIDAALASLRSGSTVTVDAREEFSAPAPLPDPKADTSLHAHVLDCIAGVLGLEVEEMGDDPQFGWTPLWDSVAHMNLMVALELRFGVEIGDEMVPVLTSPRAIVEFLAAPLPHPESSVA
jgi:predicted dehydrogenase/acyl carrier protein